MGNENKTADQLRSEIDQLRRMNDDLRSQAASHKRTIEQLQADVTERQVAQNELSESVQRFHRTVLESPFPIMIHAEDGEVLQINKIWTELTGYGPEEIPTLSEWTRLAYGERMDVVKSRIDKIFDCDTRVNEGEYVISSKDGDTLIWDFSSASLGRLPDGRRLVVSIAKDVTGQKKDREELRLHGEVMKNMAEGVYLVNAEDGIIIWANPKFEKMFGYEAGEMNGQHASIVNAPTDKDPAETASEIMEVLNKTGQWHGEVNNINKNGKSFWCYANSSIFKHPEYGRVIVAVHTDVTERKDAMNQLRESEERYRSLVENVDFGITIIDADFNVVMVNSTVGRWFSKSPSEFVGSKCYQVFEKRDHPRSLCPGAQAMATGQPCEIETEGVRDDGTRFTVKDRAFPNYGSNGEIIGFHEVLEDITERKHAEVALIQSEKKYRTLVENIPQKIFYKDLDSVYTSCNKNYADDLEITPEDIAGKTDFDFFPKHLAQKYRDDDSRIIRKGISEELEETYLKDGQEFITQTIKTPVADREGSVVGVLGIFWDITEQKQARERIENLAKFPSENPNPVLRIAADGKLLYANAAAESLVTEQGCQIGQTVPVNWQNIIADAFQKGTEQKAEIEHDGKVLSFAIAPVADAGYTNLYGRDITEQKRAEDESRVERDKLKSVFAAMNDGIYIVNQEYDIEYVNPVLVAEFGPYEGHKCYAYFHDRKEVCP